MTQLPFVTRIDNVNHTLEGADNFSETRLKDMRSLYRYWNSNEDDATLETIVYRVSRKDVPTEPGELLQCITEILPGDYHGEFFMTKGHGHKQRECTEIYLGIAGYGLVLMQSENGFRFEELLPGRAIYIPGGWNHRTVNIDPQQYLLFYSIWPANSGYDYEAVIKNPFQYRVFRDTTQGYRFEER